MTRTWIIPSVVIVQLLLLVVVPLPQPSDCLLTIPNYHHHSSVPSRGKKRLNLVDTDSTKTSFIKSLSSSGTATTRTRIFSTASDDQKSSSYYGTTTSSSSLWSTSASSTTNTTTTPTATSNNNANNAHNNIDKNNKLQGKLLKQIRQVCKDYDMLQDGDHIMVCVSGGKDSISLLCLLQILQRQLQHTLTFQMTVVHVNQKQPGYNGTILEHWLKENQQQNDVPYVIVEEDTYSIVVNKTQPTKSFCTICSRLRRGVLYTTAKQLNCNKIILGHHGDDSIETLLLNMIHIGQMKGIPARYTSQKHSISVMRPMITCFESDIANYAQQQQFPILPCNLCSNQEQTNLQRPQMKLLVSTLEELSSCTTMKVRQNMINAMSTIKPSHLLDQSLRQQCGMDPITGDYLRMEQQQQQEEENDKDDHHHQNECRGEKDRRKYKVVLDYEDDDEEEDDDNAFVSP